MLRSVYSVGVLLICSTTACSEPPAPPAAPDPAWAEGLARFRADEEISIGGPDGWITLVGRFPLEQGANSVGSDPHSVAVLPSDRAPAQLGSVNVAGDTVTWSTAAGADVRVDEQAITTRTLNDDSAGKSTLLEAGSLRLHVIRRGDVFLLRARDRDHPARAAFTGLAWFKPDPSWRVRARLEPSPPGTTLAIVNVLDQIANEPSPGHLVFSVGEKEYRLAALKGDGAGFFIVFRDQTAGRSTYPTGRFLDAPAPDADGSVDLDFNRAYSPPCAFTAFATCPLPPRENSLALAVEAGEKYAGKH
ncbi:MAG TPA: DUF1684 domain-containing protein [Myxococcota bacterium]